MNSNHPEAIRSRRRREQMRAKYGLPPEPKHPTPEAPVLSKDEAKELAELRARFAAQEALASTRFTPRVVPVEKHEAGAPGWPVTIWSDWHWGEVVRADEVGGVNEFNYDIAVRRVDKLVNATIALLQDYAGRNPVYPGITVCLGGDFFSGAIHDELVETNWAPVTGQAFELKEIIAGALTRMADVFGLVECPAVVGNHGRNAKKPRAKLRVQENNEYWLYRALAGHFRGDDRIHFTVSEQTDVDFTIYGHRFKLTHGDALGVKGGDGQIGALGPIVRGALKTNAAERHVRREFDTLLIGHWHAYQPAGVLVPTVVNGTLKGYDEYARTFLRAPYSKPSQALLLVAPKHGLAAQWPVYVD